MSQLDFLTILLCLEPWGAEEDNKLRRLVGELGATKWSMISRRLKGRFGKQCRERWHNHLCPNINKAPWTPQEELLLYMVKKPHTHSGASGL